MKIGTRYRIAFCLWLLILGWAASVPALAAADLEINTPAISSIKSSMRQVFHQLVPFYDNGAIGLTHDGFIALRDANAVPLPQRQTVNSLIAEDNRLRAALYREIARANGHPEWESEIRSTFAGRWIDKAHSGWWYQNGGGAWVRK